MRQFESLHRSSSFLNLEIVKRAEKLPDPGLRIRSAHPKENTTGGEWEEIYIIYLKAPCSIALC